MSNQRKKILQFRKDEVNVVGKNFIESRDKHYSIVRVSLFFECPLR